MRYVLGGRANSNQSREGTYEYDFRYNPLHDYESLWWIGLWLLTSNAPHGSRRSPAQTYVHNDLFEDKDEDERKGLVAGLRPDVWHAIPDALDAASDVMQSLRAELFSAFSAASASFAEFDPESFRDDRIPRLFVEELSRVMKGPDVMFDGRVQTSTVQKRKAESEAVDGLRNESSSKRQKIV